MDASWSECKELTSRPISMLQTTPPSLTVGRLIWSQLVSRRLHTARRWEYVHSNRLAASITEAIGTSRAVSCWTSRLPASIVARWCQRPSSVPGFRLTHPGMPCSISMASESESVTLSNQPCNAILNHDRRFRSSFAGPISTIPTDRACQGPGPGRFQRR